MPKPEKLKKFEKLLQYNDGENVGGWVKVGKDKVQMGVVGAKTGVNLTDKGLHINGKLFFNGAPGDLYFGTTKRLNPRYNAFTVIHPVGDPTAWMPIVPSFGRILGLAKGIASELKDLIL